MTDRITDRIEIVNADCYTLLDAWPSDAALVSDPPYGIAYCHGARKGGRLMGTDGMAIVGDDQPFDPAPFLRFATVCLWGANNFASRLPDSRAWLVWDKRDGIPSNDQADCELAWTNRPGVARLMTRYWNGGTAKGRNEARLHSNQKPVGLMGWCLQQCAVGADALVIDPFMGSGSLGVACHRAGLRYLGVEIDPEHYATAKARLQRETAQGLLCMPNAGGEGRGASPRTSPPPCSPGGPTC
jgi:site-specific DNA-methyltransferase (adenine-specific)